MLSLFGGLNMGYTGLQANQQALETTGHNIANSSREGYSRQQVIMTATTPLYGPGMNNPSGVGQYGTGVTVSKIQRIRDAFIDHRIISENKSAGYWSKMEELTTHLELIYNEPSDSGVRASLDEFWESLENLSNAEGQAEQAAARRLVIEKADSLSATMKSIYTQLQELGGNGGYGGSSNAIDYEIETVVKQVNSYAKQLAELNKGIMTAKGAGKEPNDLMDSRDVIIKELSKLANVTVTESDADDVRITFGGLVLVQGVNYFQIETRTDETGKLKMFHSGNNLEVLPSDGSIKALLDFRDTILPQHIEGLNDLAVTITDQFNEIHKTGFGLDGSTGNLFFEEIPTTGKSGIYKVQGNQYIQYADIPLNGLTSSTEPENFEKRIQRTATAAASADANHFIDVNTKFDYDTNAFDATLDMDSRVKITVNGKTWTSDKLSAYSSIDEFMDKINSNDEILEGIYLIYDNNTDKFSLTSANGESDILLEQTEIDGVTLTNNGFWTATNLTASNSETVTYTNVSDRMPISSNNDGITDSNDTCISINGYSINYDGSVDSINDIVKRINDAQTGVTASIDSTGRLTFTASKDKDYKIISLQDNGNLLYSLGILSQGKGYFGSVSDESNIISNNFQRPPMDNAVWAFGVSETVKNDINKFASIGGKDTDLDGIPEVSYGPGDNSNVLKLADLRNKALMNTRTTTFNDYFSSMVTKSAVDAQEAKTNSDTKKDLILNLENLQKSVSGVSLDEEFSNLIKYQHGYQASAKVISTIDQMIQVILGMVG